LNSNRQTHVTKSAIPKDRCLTIGLMVDDIVMVGGRNALRGVADAARERDVNLLCFHQRVFQGGEDQPIEVGPASWDALAEVVDGLVIYQSWPNEETFAAFRSRFPSLPMANALRVYTGCPGLASDAYRGTKELTCHLIEVHGYRRIVFVAGPEGNWAVEERYRGYADALAEHGVSLDPNLVTPHLDWAGAEREAVSLLIDERGLLPGTDFEAVVTSNDSIALSMLVEFQSRGVRVPDDVAVVGFDDDSQAACSTPPLTTTRVPSYEIGRQAVEVVLAQIAGEQVPEQTLVLPKMMVRRSCGCQALAVTQAATEPVPPASKEVGLGDVFETQRAQILLDMVQAIGQDDAEGIVAGWVEQVLNSFAAEMAGGTPGTFLAALEDVLGQVVAGGGASGGAGQRVAAWQGAVSALRRWVLPYLDGDKGTHAEGLWQQARVMIAVMVELAQARQALQAEQQAAALRDVSQALITTFDVDGLVDALAGGLLQLGIPGAYLSLYENPAKPVEWSRLMLAYGEEGRVDLGADGLRFPSPQLVPEGMWPQGRRYSFMVSPLFLRESQLGFILYEIGLREGTIYDTLRAQISSALQGALLVQRVQEHSAELARQQYILDTFMENVPDSIYFKDLASRFTRLNKALAFHFELGDPAEGVGKNDYDFFPEEQAQPKYEQEREIIRTGQPILNLEEPDGIGHWALTTKMPLRDENGEIIGTFGISRDITALKEAQAALEKAYAEVEQQVAERTAELEREVEERERAQAESVRLQQEVIEAQQWAIQELSTPIIPVLEGVIVMPLIGSIDTMRARDVTRSLLAGIREHKARIVILDITGVPIVDSGVAAYLNRTVQAARLKGARTIVTGISEAVAETIVDLGIDWGGIETLRDLRTGLRAALGTPHALQTRMPTRNTG